MSDVMEIISSDLGLLIDVAKANLKYIPTVFNVIGYGAKGDGVKDDTTKIAGAITDASISGGIVFLPPGTYVTGNLTVPSNVTLWFANGAKLSITNGSVVTINGYIDAGLYQIFSGLGTVSGALKVDEVYPQWWGAKDDFATDCTPSFQKAINTKRPVNVPYSDNGYIFTTGNIDLVENTKIFAEKKVTLFCVGTTLFRIATNDTEISNLRIDMNGASAGSTAILLRTSQRVCMGIRITKMKFYNCYSAIKDEAGNSNYVLDTYIEDCNCQYTKGTQITINRSRGFMTIREFIVDHTLNTIPVTWIGAVFKDFIGLELEKFDVVGPVSPLVTPVYQPAAVGLYIQGTTGQGKASIWLTRILVDNTMGDGIVIENVQNVVCNNVEAYQCLGNAMLFKDILYAEMNNTFVYGGVGLTGAPAGANGITLNGCQQMQFSNVISSFNTGSGVSVFNSTDNIFNNVQLRSNQSRGWVESGTSNRNIVTGGNMDSNTVGSLVQSGAASAFTHWLANGTYRPHDVGAATV